MVRLRAVLLVVVALLEACGGRNVVAPGGSNPPSFQPGVQFGLYNWRIADNRSGTLYSIGTAVGQTNGSLSIRSSTDQGATWTTPTPITATFASSVMQPLYRTLAANGNVIVIANANANADLIVWVSVNAGATWTSTNLSKGTSTLLAHRTAVFIDPVSGVVHIANSRQFNSPDRPIAYWRSTDNGSTWSGPAILQTEAQGGSTNPTIDASNDVVLVGWQEQDIARTWTRRSTDGGATFAPRVQLSQASQGPEGRPRLARLGNTIFCVIEGTVSGMPETRAVWGVRSTDNGATFGPPFKVTETPNIDKGHPEIDAANGVIHVTYARGLRLNTLDHDAYYIQSTDGGLTWGGEEPIMLSPYFMTFDVQATTDYVLAIVGNSTNGTGWFTRRARQ